ncbi:hypothetical protein ACWKWU_05535 [Chitinophaga lutea]
MKAALPALLLLCLGFNAMAQDSTYNAETPSRKERLRSQPYYQHLIKTNLSTIALGNYGLTYERMLTRKISASLGYRFMPKTRLAGTILAGEVMDAIKDDGEASQQLEKLQMSGNAITAEFRIYTGRRPGAKGFYAGIYGRYSGFKYDYPYDFERPDNTKTLVPIKATTKGFGGGIILGGQFNVAKRVVIDLFIIGGHYGKLTGDGEGLTDLSDFSEQERADLKSDIEGLVSIGNKQNITATVQNDGVRAKLDLPFVGLRGLGLTVGFAF